MKRALILGLGIALFAGGITSCKKTSKRKMANEWAVVKYNSETKDTDESLDVTKRTHVFEGSTLNYTYTSTPNGGAAYTYSTVKTVNAWTYTIEKDGTWSSLKDVTSSGIDSTYNSSTWSYDVFTYNRNSKEEFSGVWNFIGKSKTEDFKKNERVLFNTLSGKYTDTDNGIVTVENITLTAGDEVTVYTVVESKKKELQLQAETERNYAGQNGTSNVKSIETISLRQN